MKKNSENWKHIKLIINFVQEQMVSRYRELQLTNSLAVSIRHLRLLHRSNASTGTVQQALKTPTQSKGQALDQSVKLNEALLESYSTLTMTFGLRQAAFYGSQDDSYMLTTA
jgi:hypothetical protein